MAEQKIRPVSIMLKRAEAWQQDEKIHQAIATYFKLMENFSDTDEAHKAVYGFSIRMGLGGKPVIEQFGNIKATEEGTVVAEVCEPLVDVLDEGERVVVLAELPGVEEKDIHLEVKDDILELKAEARDRKYSKEVLLPSVVEGTMESSYRNGILEIRLKKR